MSLLQYLKLQPVDLQEDGSVSELDRYDEDDYIDLNNEEDTTNLLDTWTHIEEDLHQ